MITIRAADLFCGAGGTSTGLLAAADAMGVRVDLLAVNHWPIAIETHGKNHPEVRHLCADVEGVDPRQAVPSGRLHLLVASPECTHHSTARGGRPVCPQKRASAWHVLRWAEHLYIESILIENVPEFRSWGPVGPHGRPLKSKRGETYQAFLAALRSLGYRVEDAVLNAADYGDPTTRRRLFIIARRGNKAIRWPLPTHGRSARVAGRRKWRAAREIIDWSIPGQSIFSRKKQLSAATMKRILAGLERFGGPELRPFLVVLRNNQGGRSIEDPVPTLTTSGANVGIAQPFLLGQQSCAAARSVEDPVPTIATAGAIGMIQPFLVPLYGERDGQDPRTHSVETPVPTIPATGGGKFGVVQPFLVGAGGPVHAGKPQSIDDPVGAVLTRNHRALIEPFLVSAGGPNVDARPVSEPANTVLTRDHMALVEPFVVHVTHGGREHSADAPLPTVTGAHRGELGLVEPFILPQFSEHPPRSVDEPVGAITTTSRGMGLVEPFVVDAAFGRGDDTRRTRGIDEPLGTIPGSNRFAVVEPFILKTEHSKGNGAYIRSTDDPLHAITSAGGHAIVEPFLTEYHGTGSAVPISEPVPTLTTRDRLALVLPVVNGKALDIRFRMLQPHELAAAMGFPRDYVFTGNREQRVKQIGNAVCVNLAAALCAALLRDYAKSETSEPAEACT